MSELGHVWTAPWQELSDVFAALVGCEEGDFSSLSTCATADVRVPYFWFAILDGRPINCLP